MLNLLIPLIAGLIGGFFVRPHIDSLIVKLKAK